MLGQLARERFLLYLLVCSILGLALGFFGALAVYVILTWEHLSVLIYSVLSGGG